jgi:hypothetical protein
MSWGESGSGNQPQTVAAALCAYATARAAAVQHAPSTTQSTTFGGNRVLAVRLKHYLIPAYSAQFSAVQGCQATTSVTTAAGTASVLHESGLHGGDELVECAVERAVRDVVCLSLHDETHVVDALRVRAHHLSCCSHSQVPISHNSATVALAIALV